jgi:hypothetical protein
MLSMPRRKKNDLTKSVSAPELPPEEPVDDQPIRGPRVFKRPDGYYWDAKGRDARGPFATRAEAEADLLAGGTTTTDFEPGEGLQEAESELGISEWIDPDTGGPAEDSIPRLEDH